MQRELIVGFGPAGEVTILPDAAQAGMAPEQARRWLDDQFSAFGCEPLRASGKVLTADKLLAVADAAGRSRFDTDVGWARQFAGAALAAMGRPVVHIDLMQQTVIA